MPKVALIVGLALACAVSGGCGRARSSVVSEMAAPWAHGVGYVEPVGEVRRLAFKPGGIVASCPVPVGARVAAGDVVMTLRDEAERAAIVEGEAAVALAQAELAQLRAGASALQLQAGRAAQAAADADAAHARQEFGRQQTLLQTQAAARAMFDLAEAELRRKEAIARQRAAEFNHLEHLVRDTDLAVAAARLGAAEARLASARERWAETRLRAPGDGVVLEILRREGEAAATGGEPVLIFGDPSELCVRAEIDETQALALRPGAEAVISGPALGGREITGRVTLVKSLMGRKTVFAQSAAERKDLDALQVLIALPAGFTAPIGLEVDVRVRLPAAGAGPATGRAESREVRRRGAGAAFGVREFRGRPCAGTAWALPLRAALSVLVSRPFP